MSCHCRFKFKKSIVFSDDDDDDEAVENGNDVTNNELQPAHIQQEKQEKLTTRIKYVCLY